MDLDCVSQYKNCVKGIPCGNTCISKGKNCKPKPNAQINAVANLLAKSDNLEKGAESVEQNSPDDIKSYFDEGKLGFDAELELTAKNQEAQKIVEELNQLEKVQSKEVSAKKSLAEKLNADAPPPTEDQAKAINTYTGGKYEDINGLLRGTKSFSLKQEEKLNATIEKATEGLKSLPDYKGESYRGTVMRDEIIANMKVGGTFSDKGFLSTTSNKDVAGGFSNAPSVAGKTRVMFTIEGTTGKDISNASKFRREKEILYAPSSKFEIASIEQVGKVLQVRMKQNE